MRQLLAQVAPQHDDLIITLGDYVNRGPNVCGVIEQLIALENECRFVPILGNHDELMLEARGDLAAEQRFRYEGGSDSLKSYGASGGIADVPDRHWQFLNRCLDYFETDGFVFTHANYCWYSALTEQPASLLRWTSLDESPPRPHISGKTFVVGHTPGAIRDLGFCRCLDTGCGFGGVLTAMDIRSGRCWQVPEPPRKELPF